MVSQHFRCINSSWGSVFPVSGVQQMIEKSVLIHTLMRNYLIKVDVIQSMQLAQW